MLQVDGSEGGGQILRTSLSLGAILRQPFEISSIRGKRPNPGLQAQHLACVLAVQTITNAQIHGAHLKSTTIVYQPTAVQSEATNAKYAALVDTVFAVGTAGSAMLVLQTILPILLFACDGISTLYIEGGTHNSLAPSATFIEVTFVPILRALGVEVDFLMERVGLMPDGNGRVRVRVVPVGNGPMGRVRFLEAPKFGKIRATVLYKGKRPEELVRRIGKELEVDSLNEVQCGEGKAVGVAVCCTVKTNDKFDMVLTGSDFRNNLNNITSTLKKEVGKYISSVSIVDEYLSDQLLLYIALGLDLQYIASELSEHFLTNKDVIFKFLPNSSVSVTGRDLGFLVATSPLLT
jgi:RNA 3'-terminal phosphate cyclase (ATP)